VTSIFQRGEHIPWQATHRVDGVLTTVDTSINIVVLNPDGTTEVASTGMTEDETGVYIYNQATVAGDQVGLYQATVTITHDSQVTIERLFARLDP
jgi:uncharacterized protein YfaS (alpha-2-macroglobulin family)